MFEKKTIAKRRVDPPPGIAPFKTLSGSESNVMSADVPPQLPFEELPKFLRDKIKITPGREKTAHWYWTGEIKAPRKQLRQYPASDNYRPGPSGRYVQERATPRAKHPLTKTKTDAHRLVYSFATCVAIDDVPQLQRCADDRCVNPWHVISRGPTVAQRNRAQGLRPVAVAEEWTAERCFALLRAADDGDGVSWGVDRLTAANEAGIPHDKLTEDCWARYVREEMEKEEADAV